MRKFHLSHIPIITGIWESIFNNIIQPIPYKLAYEKVKKNQSILFYPDKPNSTHSLYRIAHLLGYKITNNPKDKVILKVHFEDNTYSKKDPYLGQVRDMVNLNSTDISKSYINQVFEKIFGYSATIDPLTYQGKCVKKSNSNALHDGKIISCPIKSKDNSYVYQKVLDNRHKEFVRDIRIPIIKNKIPFVLFKYKTLEKRFTGPQSYVEVEKTSNVLTKDELKKIIAFTNYLKLDFGELDAIRNNDDGKLYIIDVNNTPGRGPSHLEKGREKESFDLLVKTFREVFIDSVKSV